MTTLQTAAQQALEALENIYLTLSPESVLAISLNLRITALRAALAEPVQEPVAVCVDDICSEHLGKVEAFDHLPRGTLLYAILPQRKPLTAKEPVRLQCTTCGTVYADGVPPQVPEQEPIGYLWPTGRHPEFRFTQQKRDGIDGTPVYTSPPQRKPLTEEEIDHAANNILTDDPVQWWRKLARAVERAHGIGGQP